MLPCATGPRAAATGVDPQKQMLAMRLPFTAGRDSSSSEQPEVTEHAVEPDQQDGEEADAHTNAAQAILTAIGRGGRADLQQDGPLGGTQGQATRRQQQQVGGHVAA